MRGNEILQQLDEYVYSNISVNFNSDGKVLTKSELKPKVKMIKNLILNFSIWMLVEKNLSHVELQDAKDILMSQK